MRLTITMDLDNAAFEEGSVEEVERILVNLCSRLPDPLDQTGGALSLHDANGNWVGEARIDAQGVLSDSALAACRAILQCDEYSPDPHIAEARAAALVAIERA